MQFEPNAFSPSPPSLNACNPPSIDQPDGELSITPELINHFINTLIEQNISLTLISGSWSSPQLAKNLFDELSPSSGLLILAAETIYSPTSLKSFSKLLVDILQKARMSKALVATKRLYFGVGGSVDVFKEEVGEAGAVVGEVQNSGIEGCDKGVWGKAGTGRGGVGRCLLEVQMG